MSGARAVGAKLIAVQVAAPEGAVRAARRARICRTRNTTPGLCAFEKHAVRAGDGSNHRFGLDDAVLVEASNLVVVGGIRPAIARGRAAVGHLVRVEVEVDSLGQLDEALETGVDAVLIDDMGPEMLARAVERVAGRAVTEASGRVTPATAERIAALGVDAISIGWLTHSAPVLDIGLDHRG